MAAYCCLNFRFSIEVELSDDDIYTALRLDTVTLLVYKTTMVHYDSESMHIYIDILYIL